MANLCYLHGSRRHVAQLFTNLDFSRWQRVTVANTTHYVEVMFDQQTNIKDDEILSFIIGSSVTGQKGKNKEAIEVGVPGDFTQGLVYYQYLKKILGHVDPSRPFFVDAYGEPVNIKYFY